MSHTSGVLDSSRRDYWICQLGGWGSLAAVSVLSSSFSSWRTAVSFAVAKVFCMTTGLGVSDLWHRFLVRRGWFHGQRAVPFKGLFAGVFILAAVQSAFLLLADTLFRGGDLRSVPAELPSLLAAIFVLWFAVFALWTLCYAAALSRRRALRLEFEKLELEASVKDAELRALQLQVNPHFFFNSLNSIRALIYQSPDAAAQALSQLARMMRHTLQAGRHDTVRLADELAAVRDYLGMEQLRLQDRLQLSVSVGPGLDDVAMPPMALQSLVENAVKHGVEQSLGACQLRIAVSRAEGGVVVSVANQGRLLPASSSTRLGLANTSKRLSLLFGPRASCGLVEHDGWVVATLVLPQVAA